jgi:hypothetical protein
VAADGGGYRFESDGHHLRFLVRDEERVYQPGANVVNLSKLGRLHHPGRRYWLQEGKRILRKCRDHGDGLPHNMIWTPAGLTLVDFGDEAGVRYADGVLTLRQVVREWVRGTSDPWEYRRHEAVTTRTIRHLAGRLARRLLPRRVVEVLRARIRWGT